MYSLDINFLKDRGLDTVDSTSDRAVKKEATLVEKIPIFVGGMIGVVALAFSYLHSQSFEGKQAAAEAEIKKVEAEITRLQGENANLEEMQKQVDKSRRETKALVSVFDKLRPWSAILQDVSDRTPPGVEVSSLAQSGSGSNAKVEIKGFALSFNDVNDFILFLQRSPFFDSKRIILSNAEKDRLDINILDKDKLPDNLEITFPEVVEYSITAQLKNVPPSRLIKEIDNKGSVGLVTRLKILKEKGAISK